MGTTEGGESEKKHYLFVIESFLYNEATSSEEELSDF